MNRIHKIIWSAIKEKWIVVSEKAGTHGVPVMKSGALSIAALMTLGTSAWALDPGALPTGGVISEGSGLISTNGSAMTVTQTSQRMVADWQSFNIGEQASVAFMQPGANAAALNRIHDLNPSQIMGRLSSNGQVFLLNHAGIVFGKTAQVNVGSLVATSLDMADSDFMAGRYTLKNGAGAGAVLNQGSIETGKGGVVALIAPKVTNEGTVKAEGGSALLASGNRVTVDFGGDGLISYVIDQGAVDAQVSNSGLIRTDGGMAVMTAEAADALTTAVVNNTGVVEARTLGNRSGKIVLLSDMEQGVTTVGGKLDASAPEGGDGGFIETSGGRVKIGEDAVIDTHATNGKTGHWLIDPVDFTIATSGGDITGTQLGNLLGQNDVTIQTATGTDTDITQYGASGSNGDIFVNDTVSWSANHTLTLNASRNISINKNITATGSSGKVVLLYGQGSSDGTISGTQANYTLAPGAKINLQAGQNFSTKLGSAGTQIDYQVITALGNAGDANNAGNYTLQGVAHSSMLSGYYALGANIDASATQNWNLGAGFKPIGNNSNYFTGNFDGLGHTITGLTINRPTEDNVGLFGVVENASIRNLALVNIMINGKLNVGGISGVANGNSEVSACHVSGDISGDRQIGGLVGYLFTTDNGAPGFITDSSFAGNISSTQDGSSIGGLVGFTWYGQIRNSSASGSITVNNSLAANIGGLLGYGYYGTISGSQAGISISVQNQGSGIGGLLGNGPVNIEKSYATGDIITGNDSTGVGGLMGAGRYGYVSESYATGDVTAGDHASNIGGFVGQLSYGTISNCYASGSVNVGDNASKIGSFAGTNSGTITRSYTSSILTVGNNASQIAGFAASNTGTIEKTYWDKTRNTVAIAMGDSTAKTSAEMQQLITFSDWDIDDAGGTGKVWRIYEGYTTPLLRTFLTPLTVTYTGSDSTVTYDGQAHVAAATFSMNADDIDWSNLNGRINAGTYASAGIFPYSSVYDLTLSGTPGTLTILQKELTLSGLTAGNRDYNATTSATISNWGTLQGIVSGDTVNLTHSSALAAFSDANAGMGKTVTVTGLTLDNTNYKIASQTTTADISQADITVSIAESGKTYDGTVSATGTPALISGTLYGTDRITGVTAAYENPNVGTGKRVLVTGAMVSDGNSGQNYNVTLQDSSNGIINRAPLAVKANDDRKMFDGNAYEGGNGVQYSGFVNGETASVLSGSLVYGGTSQGAVRSGRYAITPGGLGSGNYAIEWQDGELRIDPAIDEPKQVSRTVPTIASDAVPGTATPMPVLSMVSSDPFAGIPGGITVRIVASPSGAQQGVVRVSVPKDQAGLGATFDIPLPASLFDAGGSASVEMTLADGGRLPQWLSYDSRNRLMKAVDVPPGAMPLTLLVRQDGVSWTMEIRAEGVDHALAMGGGR